MSNILEHIENNLDNLPKLEIVKNEVKVEGLNQKLLTLKDNIYTLKFLRYDRDEEKYKYRYTNLKFLKVEPSFDIKDILGNNLSLNYQNHLDSLLNLNQKNIKTIDINSSYTDFFYVKKTLKISPQKYFELLNVSKDINTKGKRYRNSVERYYTNQYIRDIFNVNIERRTLINKGEFKFLIDRLNLPNKNKAKDFYKYLNKNDLISLEELCEILIKKEVFDQSFLNRLDDYFIKEKLINIIKIGNRIIDIGKDDLSTQKAKNVIEKLSPEKQIKQLESVWQKYFEKYLLYLIFSYRKIYSKVEFNVNGEKKYPDFIGINHYRGVDIIEIKTHLKPALTYDSSHGNYAFSGELSKAIIQTMNYIDAIIQQNFNKEKNDDEVLESILKENIIRPRGIIIISSENHLTNGIKSLDEVEKDLVIRDFTKLRNSLDKIEILTFSEILNTAENYSENIVDKK